jgi:hypothetical protein
VGEEFARHPGSNPVRPHGKRTPYVLRYGSIGYAGTCAILRTKRCTRISGPGKACDFAYKTVYPHLGAWKSVGENAEGRLFGHVRVKYIRTPRENNKTGYLRGPRPALLLVLERAMAGIKNPSPTF